MPAEEDLYARERELAEQIAKLSQYDRELQAIQERLDLLAAREQSDIPLSPLESEVREALLISREATLAALQEDFPGVPETPSGIEQARSRMESEAYAVQVELDERVSQGLIRLPEPAYDALFPPQANAQQQGLREPETPKPEKSFEDELNATMQRLKATVPELSAYEVKLREMESTLGSLRYRVNSNIELSREELQQFRELPNQLRETRKAFREEYPGVPATVNGIEKEIQRYQNIIGSIALYAEGHIQLNQLKPRLEEQGIQLPGQQINLQQQPGHHDRPPEEHHPPLRERFRQAEEARKVQEPSQEYDHSDR